MIFTVAWSDRSSGLVQEPSTRPNILVIVTDDQRADTFGHLDSIRRYFREGGTEFSNAYATSPICCPSRASILTGLYPHNHGVLTQAPEHRSAAEESEKIMIQKRLQDSGYSTGMFGKLLNNWDLSRNPANLDTWSIFARSSPNGYRDGPWNIDGRIDVVERYSTNYIQDHALDFIDQQELDDSEPWFLYLAPAAAHEPYVPEDKYRHKKVEAWAGNPAVFESDLSDKPLWVQTWPRARVGQKVRQKQIRTLLSVDDMVRRLFKELIRLGENGDTIAIFTSDNGMMWDEHGLASKRWPYLQSPKVPLLVRWPGRIPEGVTDDRLVANIDIAPTLAEVSDVEIDSDGRSLLSADSRDRLLLEYFRSGPGPPTWAATLTPDYQYIEYYDDAGAMVGREHYDLAVDPWQLTNVLGDSDPANDPSLTDLAQLSLQLSRDRGCRGRNDCP